MNYQWPLNFKGVWSCIGTEIESIFFFGVEIEVYMLSACIHAMCIAAVCIHDANCMYTCYVCECMLSVCIHSMCMYTARRRVHRAVCQATCLYVCQDKRGLVWRQERLTIDVA